MLLFTLPKRAGRAFALTLLLVLTLCTSVRAQDIRLNVIVPTPPPVTWEAYLEFDADILIIVSNVGNTVHELKLVPTLTSDRGLSAAFKPDYQPISPLTIAPGETLNLTYRDLRALFGTPTEDDIALEGINFDRLFASETIPEGNYTLCVEARDFLTNEALSNNFGCSIFYVQQHEPPLIIWPFDGETVTALEPQFLNFLWSTTGIPGRTRYRLALYDLDELGLFNPADAFQLAATRPLYEVDDLIASNLPYDLALPPLIPGHRYAVQVIAYDPEGELLFAQEGRSAVHQFTYQRLMIVGETINDGDGINDGPGSFQTQTPGQQVAMEACPDLEPPTPSASGPLTAGTTLTVGQYELVLNSGGTPPLAGTGRLLVESLNTYVNVSFTGLQVNQGLEVYGESAIVTATQDANPNLGNLSQAEALQLADLVDNNGNWLNPDGNNPGAGINLPAGITGAGMDLLFTGMTFTPTGATVDLFAKIELPEAQVDSRLLLVGQGACLNSDNLGANMDLLLAEDQAFALGPGVDMTFAGGDAGTRLRWNEQGIDELDVDMTLDFAGEVMPEGSPFSARVTATVADYQDWIGTVTLGPDQQDDPVPTEEVTFNYNKVEVQYDHSSVQNPVGLSLPPTHPDAGQANLWQGLYLAEFDVIFPEGFDVTVAAENLLLDASGVWTRIDVEGNLLDINDGELGGWALGVDGLELDVRASAFHSASFDGRIRLPLGATELAFTAPLDSDEDFSFALEIGQELDVDMWVADISLAENSTVAFTKTGNGYVPETELHGDISLGWDSGDEEEGLNVSEFNLPGLAFQNFTIRGGPNPTVSGEFGLDLEVQGSMQNFPLQLNGVSLELAPNNIDVGLQLDLGLKLSGNEANGFEGSTVFTIWGERTNGQYNYKETQFNKVIVDAELNLISLRGELDIYDGDATYGDGFAAAIEMDINNIGLGFDCRLQVGRAPDGFRYFMTDALLMLPDPGIQLGTTPFAIYGFGGGVWRNMERESNIGQFITYDPNNLAPQVSGNANPGSSATFTPTQGTTGFSMTLVTGISGSKKAVNADLEFTMTIGDDFSVDEITLGGGVYVIQPMNDRGSAFISGTGELKLDFDDQIFTLTVEGGMDFSLPKAIDVDVQAPLYAGFSTGGGLDWWFWLGRWTDGVNPMDDTDARVSIKTGIDLGIASVESTQNLYFVMGNVWPEGEPGVPPIVTSQFNEDGKTVPTLNLPPGTTNTGFAFGMARAMDLDFDVRIFKLEVDWLWGFDLALRDLNGVCDADDFGINNWYADGKAYAHLHVAGSVQGRLFGKTRKFKFVELDAAARLDFAGPNPVWIKGTARIHGRALGKLIKFDTNVSFEFGEKVECRDGGTNIFDEIPIVEQLDPDDGVTGRSIFTAPQASFNFPNFPFPIEEDNGTVNYYGYKQIYCKVFTRKKKSDNWQLRHANLEGSYDDEGYAAYFDPGTLPEKHWVKVELRVQGIRYKSEDAGDGIDEFFVPLQTYITEFKTGPAPDRILRGSISSTVPFRRQLFFTHNDHPTGRIDFGTSQAQGIFRNKPNDEDKLDPNGRFEYVVRFTSVASGISIDAPVTSKNRHEGITFTMPNYLAPETVYKADLLRLYFPPAGTNNNNTQVSMVELKMYAPPNLGFVNPIPGGNDDDDNDGGNIQVTLANVGAQQGAPPGNANGYQFAGQNNQTNGLNQTATLAIETVPPGPDPTPELGFQNEGTDDGPGLGGMGTFQNPGGELNDLERKSRELKSKGRTTATVVKSLWPKNQKAWYFRTSKFPSMNAKIAGVSNPIGEQTRSYSVSILTDDNYEETKQDIKLPYIIIRSEEAFDRYETKYWTKDFKVYDGEQRLAHKDHSRKFFPAVKIEGAAGQWRENTFYNTAYGIDDGLYREPLFDIDDWCSQNFPAVEGEGIGNSTQPGGEDNGPLHQGGNHTWEDYMRFDGSGYSQFSHNNRFDSNAGPFVRKAYQRRFAEPFSEFGQYDYAKQTVEFVQWKPNINGLGGSGVTNNRAILTQAMIDAVQPIDIQGGIGELAGENQSNIPNVMPAFADVKVALIDYTEWIAFLDYVKLREVLAEGIEELRDNFGPDGSVFPEHELTDCNTDGQGDPEDLGDLNGWQLDGGRSFYHFYYRQIRSYLHKPTGSNTPAYFPYPTRPPGEYQFLLEGQPIYYQLPQVNPQHPTKN